MRSITRLSMIIVSILVLMIAGVSLFSLSPAQAATITDSNVTCRFVSVSGKTEVNTSYVRVQVVLASDLSQVLAQQVVHTRPRAGAAYASRLDIRKAKLAEGTHIIISVGEWDGKKYLRPATLSGVDCSSSANTLQTPTPVASPTAIPITMTATPRP